MKKTVSFLSNLFLTSTLFWSVPMLAAEELVLKETTEVGAYCHMRFPEMREETLGWAEPILDDESGKVVDFYGACDYDPTGIEAINAQRRILHRGMFGDGD
jgi:hypothetical protein